MKHFLEGLFRYHSENCFLTHVSAEFDSRDGEVKQRIVEIHETILEHLGKMLLTASQNGQLSTLSEENVKELAVDVLSVFMGSQILFQLEVVPHVVSVRRRHLSRLFGEFLTEKTPEEILSWLRSAP